jgi:glycine oxidase
LPDPDEPDLALPTEEWHSEGIVFEQLDRAGLDRLEPGLAPCFRTGVYLPGMAQVRNPRHLKALHQGCIDRGVKVLPDWPVTRLVLEGSRVVAVEGEKERLSAAKYLLASGAWTDRLLEQVGHRPGIRPVRGQIALLNTGWSGIKPLLLVGKRYVVPRPDGRLLVGSTEEEAGFDAHPTAGGIAGLLEFVTRLLPALAGAWLEQSWAGLRPGSIDGLPYLGAVPGWENLHIAAGHFRAGLQLSPASGLAMMCHLLGRPTPLPLDGFRLDRPAAPLTQTAFRS